MELTPDDMALLEQSEKALKEAVTRVMTLNLATTPEGAQVTVDGCKRGRTPFSVPVFLAPGPHRIQAELDGYVPAQLVIKAKAGETLELTMHLLRPSHTEVPATMNAPVKEASPAASHAAAESER
ncbi:PEGA domain-containing protein [Sorangium sp. So ce1036]|uniref:PEGA domain-containing protein n=1 Tax=Sorangium sp. So ce1036 TaxID=3133328 RepID=UPI003F0200B4